MPASTDSDSTRRRILVVECKQEVSTFNPNRSGYDDFNVWTGQEFFDHHRDVASEGCGVCDVLAECPEFELVPVWGASCKTCGGTLAAAAWRRLRNEYLAAINSAPEPAGIMMCLHGAMAAEDEDDPEGWLLQRARARFGQHVPIVTSLDLHGIATERMFALSDAVVAYHTYPHVDIRETGQRAARVMLRILKEGARPVTARVTVPVLVRGDELITATGAIGEPMRLAQDFESRPAGLSAGLFIGNPFTDVRELQSCAFAVADDDEAAAREIALRTARMLWRDRRKMQVALTSVEAAMEALCQGGPGTVILVDAADATSSGASGDSNVILRALLESGYPGRVLLPIVDAPAVAAAMAAGVGASLAVELGGTLDPDRFEPVGIKGTVRLLSDGRFPSESWGGEWNAGPTAVIASGNLTIVAMSRAVHLFDRSLFHGHGQDPRRFDAVVVKSPHCQHHMFAAWCREMIQVDADGATSANLRRLGHTGCPRPIFPLDDDVPFAPVVTVFKR